MKYYVVDLTAKRFICGCDGKPVCKENRSEVKAVCKEQKQYGYRFHKMKVIVEDELAGYYEEFSQRKI